MLEEILIGVLALCALNTLLAVMMVIADATVGNYGRATLTVNDSRKLDVAAGQSLLATLKSEGLFIPSACGGRGSCGLCKVRLAAAGDPLATELPWLTAAERRQGIRLACQVRVKGDLALFVPEELLSVKEYRARVESMRDLTHDIKELRLRLLNPPAMEFVPGQFVQLEVPPYALTSEPIYRAYSISSDAVAQDIIELEIRYVPHGICTTWVHKHLKEGAEVTFNGPHGDFHIREGEGEILCIAGGSGMAPIKSMLLSLARTDNRRPVRYFFGARARRDLFLTDEMRALERRMPSFTFIPALSAPQPDDDWQGARGRIDQVLESKLGDVAGTQAYLCGSPLMIDACVKVLRAKGVQDDAIFFDKFT